MTVAKKAVVVLGYALGMATAAALQAAEAPLNGCFAHGTASTVSAAGGSWALLRV